MADTSVWAISPLGVVVKAHILFFSPPSYVALWESKTPQRPTDERVSWCLETSPPSWLPPWDGSLSLTLLTLFLSFIFCPTSFWRECAAFLGAWCPPPAFRSCFVEVSQHSNDLLMILWGRQWPPLSIPPPSCLSFLGLLDIVCHPLLEGSDYYLIVIPHNFPEKSMRKVRGWP